MIVWMMQNYISPLSSGVVWGVTSEGMFEERSAPGVCPVTVVEDTIIEDKDVGVRDGR